MAIFAIIRGRMSQVIVPDSRMGWLREARGNGYRSGRRERSRLVLLGHQRCAAARYAEPPPAAWSDAATRGHRRHAWRGRSYHACGGVRAWLEGCPHAGVHRNLLYAILDCPKVHRVVYVCSKADSVVRDLLLLLTPARAAKRRHNAVHKGNVRASAPTRYQPFKPVRAVPVDTSPQTTLFDIVVLLER